MDDDTTEALLADHDRVRARAGELAAHPDARVRRLAARLTADVGVAAHLAGDPDELVRADAVANLACPAGVRADAALESSWAVRLAAVFPAYDDYDGYLPPRPEYPGAATLGPLVGERQLAAVEEGALAEVELVWYSRTGHEADAAAVWQRAGGQRAAARAVLQRRVEGSSPTQAARAVGLLAAVDIVDALPPTERWWAIVALWRRGLREEHAVALAAGYLLPAARGLSELSAGSDADVDYYAWHADALAHHAGAALRFQDPGALDEVAFPLAAPSSAWGWWRQRWYARTDGLVFTVLDTDGGDWAGQLRRAGDRLARVAGIEPDWRLGRWAALTHRPWGQKS